MATGYFKTVQSVIIEPIEWKFFPSNEIKTKRDIQ